MSAIKHDVHQRIEELPYMPPHRLAAAVEPTSWALMLLGFGAVGLASHRRKGQRAAG